MTIEEMLAREAIRWTIELYNRNADTADYDRHRDVFHPDAVMEVQGGGMLQGVDAIIAAMRAGAEKRRAYEPGNFQRHNITSIMIEPIEGDRARATVYLMVITEKGLDHTGRYDDEYCKVGDLWLIRRRFATMEWANPESRFVGWLGAAGPKG
ncbi:MAG TPA: nuclear transport factor 2 family protein [Sphingomonas sp.]|nr:nuclear transport factor 2 family protein [Sphingomonas sp.]